MKQTVAAYIAKTLEQAGVKRIWGVTGDSLNGLSDSLNRMGTIDWKPQQPLVPRAAAAGDAGGRRAEKAGPAAALFKQHRPDVRQRLRRCA